MKRSYTYRLVLCLYREYWSNESFVDVLRMGIRYTAAKVFRRAEKVILIIKVLIDTDQTFNHSDGRCCDQVFLSSIFQLPQLQLLFQAHKFPPNFHLANCYTSNIIYPYISYTQVDIPKLVLNKLLRDITVHLHVYLSAREKGTIFCVYNMNIVQRIIQVGAKIESTFNDC